MKRIVLFLVMAGLATAPLIAGDANAPMACCRGGNVKRTVTNLDNGVKITMSSKNQKVAAMLQEMSATCFAKGAPCCKDCPLAAEGVTHAVEKTASGVVITATATDPALVKKLQAAATTMTAGCCSGKACCKDGKGAGIDGRCCAHAASDTGKT